MNLEGIESEEMGESLTVKYSGAIIYGGQI